MDLYELLEKRNPVDKEKKSKSLVDQLIKRNEVLSNENKVLKKKIDTLKLLNSDYYNQICTLSSKLSIINNYINDNKNCVPKHINDFINETLFDKYIKLGDKE